MTGPDRWLTVRVPVRSDDEAGLLSELLIEAGARGTIETDGRLTAHFLPPESPDDFLSDLGRRLGGPEGDASLEWSWTPQEEWAEVWKRGLEPRRVGRRIVVTPSWCDPDASPDDIVIVIDPKMAFGTAEHATTRGCLRLLETVVEPGQRLLDIGSGSGILAIAAARLGAEAVRALESDPLAIDSAVENLKGNGVGDRVVLVQALVESGDLAAGPAVDGCIANIRPAVLLSLMPGLARCVRNGGWLILSGIPTEEGRDVVDGAEREGFTMEAQDMEEGWVTLLLRRRAAAA